MLRLIGRTKMKKRILGIIISTSLIMTMAIFPSNVAAASLPTKQAFASTINNIPELAGNLNVSNSSTDNVQFGNVTINGSNIEITGSTGNGTATNFDLIGTLYKGIVSTRIDGVLTDKLNNFKVDRFELLSDPQHSILMNKNLTGNVLALYLQKNGTRNVSFIECEASTVFSDQQLSNINSASENYLPAPNTASLWEEAMFQPDSHTHNRVSNLLMNNLIASPTPLSNSKITSYNDSYVDYYYIFGYYVNDTITLNLKTSEPTDDTAHITGTLSIAALDWNESNGIDVKNSATGFEVGFKSPGAGLKLTVPSPAGIEEEWFDGTVEHAGGVQISADIGWTIPYTPIDLSLSLTNSYNGSINGGSQTFKTINAAHEASAYIPSGEYLQSVGDELDAAWSISNYYGTATTITPTISYIFNLYNGLDNGGDNWGTESDPVSWSMKS
jgi:hypothetical protein